MRFPAAILLATALLLAPPARADRADDIDTIVDLTITPAAFKWALASLKPIIAAKIENELRRKDIVISDTEAFADIVFQEFLNEFVAGMRISSRDFYGRNFSDAHLADIAAFYRSEAGQALLDMGPAMTEFGGRESQRIGPIASERAAPRIADRLEAEGIVVTQDKSMMNALIEALRGN